MCTHEVEGTIGGNKNKKDKNNDNNENNKPEKKRNRRGKKEKQGEQTGNVVDRLSNSRSHGHNVPVTKALNRDILAAEKERKKRRKEEEEEVPYMV